MILDLPYVFAAISLVAGFIFFLYATKYYLSVFLALRNHNTLISNHNHLYNNHVNNFNNRGRNNSLGNHNNHGNTAFSNHLNRINHLNSWKNNNGPFISIHLPIYNEPNVAERLVKACTSFDYGNYEVIVIDDSTDETTDILRKWSSHPRVKLIHRTTRQGYKPGALSVALQHMSPRAQYVLIFDADFIPPPYILNYFVPYFAQPAVAREDVISAILDLDSRFVDKEISVGKYLEKKEKLVELVVEAPERSVDERNLATTIVHLDQLFTRGEIDAKQYLTRRETFITRLQKRRHEAPWTREFIVSQIPNLDKSYAENKISYEEYQRKRQELIQRLKETEKGLPTEISIMSSIFELDRLFAEDRVSVEEYLEKRGGLIERLEALGGPKEIEEVRAEETLIELGAKPTEKDRKTLSEILELDSLFATDRIIIVEYLERRQRLVGELEVIKKREEKRGPATEKALRVDLGLDEKRTQMERSTSYPIFEFDRLFAEDKVGVEDYLNKREKLVEKVHQETRLRYDLKRIIQLYRNHNIAAVQSYQHHFLNSSENWLTRGIRAEYSASYMVERSAQEFLGLMKMIAGSVYMIRADLLREYGWSTSITEDWELTLRLYRDGYKVLYTPLNSVPAECPSTFKRLVKQRMRWAEGHTYNVRKYFSEIMRSSEMKLREKLEFLYYSPYYLQSFLFILGTICWLISEALHRYLWHPYMGWALVLYNLLAIPTMAITGLFLEGTLKKDFTGALSTVMMTYLLAPFQAYASMKGLLEKKEGPWIRTFKTGKITEHIMLTQLRMRKRLLALFPRKWLTSMKGARMRIRRAIFGPPERAEIRLADEMSILTAIFELDHSFAEDQITTEEYLSERQNFVADLMIAKRRKEKRLKAEKPGEEHRTRSALFELDNLFTEGQINVEEYLRRRTELVKGLQGESEA